VTGDSDVMTLVCPSHMEQDEWHAYAQQEVEALHSADFHPVSFSSGAVPICQDTTCSLRHQVFFEVRMHTRGIACVVFCGCLTNEVMRPSLACIYMSYTVIHCHTLSYTVHIAC